MASISCATSHQPSAGSTILSQGQCLSRIRAYLVLVSGLIPAGSTTGKQYERASSQPSSPTRGSPPLSPSSKGAAGRESAAKGPGEGALQLRETNEEEHQALEPEGSRVLSALMEGIQSDFLSLVRPGALSSHILCSLQCAAQMFGSLSQACPS